MSAEAKISLPPQFSDNMVLQRNSTLSIHGLATPGKEVTLTTGWNGKESSAVSGQDGKWELEIATPDAGGPYSITISDGSRTELNNVMIGEVWFCSGQSNMEMPLAGWGKVMDYEQEIAQAQYPQIRLFQVRKSTATSPQENCMDTMGGWQECSPATVPEFSSVAYFYARMLWKELGIPVGVIDCTWGGTPAEAWTSYEAVRKLPDFHDQIGILEESGFDKERIDSIYNVKHEIWENSLAQSDRGMSGQKALWAAPDIDDSDWKSINAPGIWENQGLEGFDGTVWYRKTIEIPSKWAGKSITLGLGRIDDMDITYVNGTEIARGRGHGTLRTYTIPAGLTESGTVTVCTRVIDTGGEGGIKGLPEEMYLCYRKDRIPISGEWKIKTGTRLDSTGNEPVSPVSSPNFPTVLYNAMVNPLTGFPVEGVIWYQGEANADRAAQYEVLFQSLIRDWRIKFRKPGMPFYFVQLANFMERKDVQPDSHWAALRESQSKALALENTGMAVTIDIGDARDIHPKNKQEVARRLGLIALKNAYGKNVIDEAPSFTSYKVINGRAYIIMSETGEDIMPDNDIKGFTIAGPDRKFYPARAYTDGNYIVVESPHVALPVSVRYGWADNPECTLRSESGLPVAPFRTDNWTL